MIELGYSVLHSTLCPPAFLLVSLSEGTTVLFGMYRASFLMLQGLVCFDDMWFSSRLFSIVSIYFQHCIQLRDIPCDNVGACKVERNSNRRESKTVRFVVDSSRSCTEMGLSFHGGRKQIQ